jgi:hypothetical protein
MKTILSLCALSLVCSLAVAQAKTSSGKPAAKKTVKSAPAKSSAAKKPAAAPQKKVVATGTPAAATVKNETVNNTPATTTASAPPKENNAAVAVKKDKLVDKQALYSSAVGLRFLWGVALTGKHFFKEHHAAEAIFRFRGYHGVGSDMNLTLLYEYHGDIPVEGLRWYAGAGVFAGHFRLKNKYMDAWEGYYGKRGSTYFGMSGILGAEYKIKNIPLAVSADWQPSFLFNSGYFDSGFTAECGGLGVKYTF